MKNKIREITSRKKPYSMDYRIKKLNQYLMGEGGYFALADTPSVFIKFDSWIKGRHMNGATHAKATGEYLKVRYYKEPSETSVGVPKGSKV